MSAGPITTPDGSDDSGAMTDPSATTTGFLLAIAAVVLAQMISSIDTGGTNTASRTIQEGLGTTLTSVQLVIGGFMLFSASTVMLGARLGDVLGRRRVLIFGVSLRVVSLIVAATAPNLATFFLGRAVLGGIGTAMCLACGASIVSTSFTGDRRTRAFVFLGSAVALGGLLGPLVAGWMCSTIGWRWFYVFVLVIAIASLSLSPWTPAPPPITDRFEIDLVGAALSIVAFGCLIFGIQQSTQWGLFNVRNAPFTIMGISPVPFLILLGALLIGLFAYVEHRRRLAGRPILFDLRMLTDRFVRNGAMALLMFASVLFGVTFLMPVYMQVVEGLSPFETGLRFAAYGAGALVFGYFVPGLSRRFALRGLLAIGVVASIVAAIVMAWEISPLPWGATPLGFAILGIGLALSKSRVSSAMQAAVPYDEQGQASGISEAVWAIGGALGVAVIGTLMLATLAVGVTALVDGDPGLSVDSRATVEYHLSHGVGFIPLTSLRGVLEHEQLPETQISTLAEHYTNATKSALLLGLGGAVVLALGSLAFALRLPRRDPVVLAGT